METKLLPCPFCGGEAVVELCGKGNFAHWCVWCNCGVLKQDHKTEADAIEAWNTRHERMCDGCEYHRELSEYWCEECSRYYCDFYTPKEDTDADQR